jgi:hypothetical protein
VKRKYNFGKHNFVIPALVAGILAGCSGGNTTPGTSGTAPALAAATASATTWTSVVWGGGGYVTGLVYHPTNASLLYARTDVGGAYRWNATTASWTPITDGLGFGGGESQYHGVESLALDPNNDQLVYLMTGDTVTGGANGRIYISSNQGASWTHYDLPFPVGGNDNGRAIGERLAVDPNNPSTLFYGSRTAGLWKSTDSGHTWTQVTGLSSTTISGSNSPIGIEQVVFDTSTKGSGTATQTIYASVAPDYEQAATLVSTLYKSIDGGTTWTPVVVPVNVIGFYIPHIVRAADGYFYMVFNQNAGQGATGPGYLYKFGGTTFGETWNPLSSSTVGGYAGVAVSGTGATARIVLGVTGTWGDNPGQVTQLSDDGGLTWHEIEANMVHTGTTGNSYSGWNDYTTIDPANRDHIMHVHGGGIWETTNASSLTPTWNAKVKNLEETATLSVTTPPAGATYKFINSAGDIGTWVDTNVTTKPTKGPMNWWSSGNSADMAWNDPLYIAIAGVDNANGHAGVGYWSGDGGTTWSKFASLPAGAAANTDAASNIAVTSRNNAIWAPPDSVPSYTTDNGATWTATNLPALTPIGGFPRAYRLKVDRKNPNKVYAYDSGGAWWGNPGQVFVSTDAGHTFTLSQGSVAANLRANPWGVTSMEVNPNVEGDIWLADGNDVYHSTDSGATWKKLNIFASVWGDRQTWSWPYVQGANVVTLGKAAKGASYSAAVYVSGVINGQWGVYRSDNGGATWTRFNDDAHQFGGIHHMAADWNTYGRIYVNGEGRGLIYSN